MKREYVYVECYGEVYRFTKASWTRMLKKVAAGQDVRYSDYASTVCIISHNITDLDSEIAQSLLGN